jgi:hypothetical protein
MEGVSRMIYVEWASFALCLLGCWAVAERWYFTGFTLSILSNLGWAIIARETGLWGLFWLEWALVAISLRGIQKRISGAKKGKILYELRDGAFHRLERNHG